MKKNILFLSFLIFYSAIGYSQPKESSYLVEKKTISKNFIKQFNKESSANAIILKSMGYKFDVNNFKNYEVTGLSNVIISIMPYYIGTQKAGDIIIQLSTNKNYKNITAWKFATDKEILPSNSNNSKLSLFGCGSWTNNGSRYCKWVLACPGLHRGMVQPQRRQCTMSVQTRNVIWSCYCL